MHAETSCWRWHSWENLENEHNNQRRTLSSGPGGREKQYMCTLNNDSMPAWQSTSWKSHQWLDQHAERVTALKQQFQWHNWRFRIVVVNTGCSTTTKILTERQAKLFNRGIFCNRLGWKVTVNDLFSDTVLLLISVSQIKKIKKKKSAEPITNYRDHHEHTYGYCLDNFFPNHLGMHP